MHKCMVATATVAMLAVSEGTVAAQGGTEGYRPVTTEMLMQPPPEDWLMWRGNYSHWGYSPLEQINTENVHTLRLAWSWTLAEGSKQRTTPLVHDGVMFLPQHCDYIEALDATTGAPLWEYYRPQVEHPAIGVQACVNRNGALHGERLFVGTHDAHLLALDVHTGEVVWEKKVGDWTIGHHYSGGPQIIKGMVVAGMSGCYMVSSSCWISAHDMETGEEIWRRNTIPAPGEFGADSWGNIPVEQRTGGSMWNAPSFDPELNLIFVGTAVPTLWGAVQRGTEDGDILYTNSTLALDADTGEIVWYFQHIPNDEWDLDHPFARIIAETVVSPASEAVEWLNPEVTPGTRRKVITGIPGKTGIVWTLDAATGEFLWARSTNYQNVMVGVDPENRRAVMNPALKLPDIGEEIFVCPTPGGGINWQTVGYSPQTNAIYTPTNNLCMNYSLREDHATPGDLGAYHASARSTRVHVPGSDENVGLFSAIDVSTGRTKWEIRQRAGFGGSVLTTGGGLVFVTDDARRFRALDSETGEVRWEQLLNSHAGGYPVAYMVDGVQYIAIAAGHGQNYLGLTPEIQQRGGGNILYVFRLP